MGRIIAEDFPAKRDLNAHFISAADSDMYVVPTAEKAPKVDHDKVPRELTVIAGKDVDIEIPYTGKKHTG